MCVWDRSIWKRATTETVHIFTTNSDTLATLKYTHRHILSTFSSPFSSRHVILIIIFWWRISRSLPGDPVCVWGRFKLFCPADQKPVFMFADGSSSEKKNDWEEINDRGATTTPWFSSSRPASCLLPRRRRDADRPAGSWPWSEAWPIREQLKLP